MKHSIKINLLSIIGVVISLCGLVSCIVGNGCSLLYIGLSLTGAGFVVSGIRRYFENGDSGEENS